MKFFYTVLGRDNPLPTDLPQWLHFKLGNMYVDLALVSPALFHY